LILSQLRNPALRIAATVRAQFQIAHVDSELTNKT
jgi:hypothetical protein